jgi:hypothetical protein
MQTKPQTGRDSRRPLQRLVLPPGAIGEGDLLTLRCEMTLLSIRAGKAMRVIHAALDRVAELQERIEETRARFDKTKSAYDKLQNK